MNELGDKFEFLKELGITEELEKEGVKKIKVYVTKKKFRKLVTVIEGLTEKEMKDLIKFLKQKLACGGTVKDNMIILQGDHRRRIKQLLVAKGYPEDVITISEELL